MRKDNTIKHETEINETITPNKNVVTTTDTKVDYDDLLSSAGEFGLYQALLMLATCPFYIYGVFSYFTQMFLTEASKDHWCWIPELANISDVERKRIAIPIDNNTKHGFSKCSSYVADWQNILMSGIYPNETWPTQRCQNGWEFNKTEIPYATITSDFGWVCDKDSYQATAQSIYFVGSSVGGLIIGWVADKYGRVPAAVASNIIGCVAGTLSSFSRNFTEFAVSRFFMGMSYDNCMMMTYLLLLEYVAPKYRSRFANLPFAVFYTLAATLLPWLALACNNWVTLSLATSIPMALVIVAPFVIPESPRWLLSKGRVDEVVYKISKIAEFNNKSIPQKVIQSFKANVSKSSQKSGNIMELLRRPIFRKMFVCICIEYMCGIIVFDALVRSLGQFDFNYFVSFTLVSFTELPSLLLIAFILDYTGRKWLTIVSMFVSCIFCVLSVFTGGGVSSVVCAVIARFASNMSINTAFQWAPEMMPTCVRGSASSVVHICGYLAAILSPLIIYLEKYAYWLPLVIVGAIAIIGALVGMLLPETALRDLPQTFEDGEDMLKNQKFFDIPMLKKKIAQVRPTEVYVNSSFE